MRVGEQHVSLDTQQVMTIINITPDSFFGGSRTWTQAEIAERVDRAVDQGAAILDVGGYSSRPGADDVSVEQECERVMRGLEIIRKRHPQIVVSIDTFRSEVVRRAIEQFGECIINDISAGELDPQIVDVAAHFAVPYIAMHMRSNPAQMQQHTDYDDLVAEVREYFVKKVEQLRRAGIEDIVLDPGFGFAKTTRQNYDLLHSLADLSVDGLPLLVGVSRKSMIYKVLGVDPQHALNGTTALHWEALRGGASILRVHDTHEAVEVIKLYNYYVGND